MQTFLILCTLACSLDGLLIISCADKVMFNSLHFMEAKSLGILVRYTSFIFIFALMLYFYNTLCITKVLLCVFV